VAQTLLLADDSVTIQRVIELTFADQDIQVVAVSDGDQAIAALQKTPPDIVLADVGMPGRSGYDVAKYVKGTPQLAHIPVVLLTGAFEPVDQDKASSAGCDGVLAKPFEPQLVIGRVKELLARPKQIASPKKGALPPLSAVPAPRPKEAAQALADDYFDRLDQALASASSSGFADASSPNREAAEPVDWLARPAPIAVQAPAPPAASAVVSQFKPVASTTQAASAPPAPVLPVVALASVPASAAPGETLSQPVRLPPLAEAFTALLAAEQAAPGSSPAPVWPQAAPVAVIGDDVVEQVTRRVLDQLSDRIVRETVADIVSAAAERLVHEEIEKIKRALK
jgi:CheY-like chemotaxis protein